MLPKSITEPLIDRCGSSQVTEGNEAQVDAQQFEGGGGQTEKPTKAMFYHNQLYQHTKAKLEPDDITRFVTGEAESGKN